MSKRDHLLQVQKQIGKRLKELEPIEFPKLVANIWTCFIDLSYSRTSGMSMNPLSYTEIKNYLELTGTYLSPEEVKALKRLDASYMRIMTSAK